MRLLVDSVSVWLVGDLIILLVRFPVTVVVDAVANDDDDVLTIFMGIVIAANSVETDLLVIGDVKNDDEQKLSKIGVFVLALAVWWCKLDKDEGVSRFTRDQEEEEEKKKANENQVEDVFIDQENLYLFS